MWHFVAKIHNDEAFNIIFDVIKKYMKNIGMYNKQIMDIQRLVPIRFNKQNDYPLTKYYNNKQIKIINLNSPVNDKKIFINNIYFKRERSFAKGNIVGLENLNA